MQKLIEDMPRYIHVLSNLCKIISFLFLFFLNCQYYELYFCPFNFMRQGLEQTTYYMIKKNKKKSVDVLRNITLKIGKKKKPKLVGCVF